MSYLTTPTSFITVDGTQIAYREMSAGASRLPLVMLVHLAANLDNWDPRTVDQLAQSRLILLDLPGVGASRRLALSEASATSASTCWACQWAGCSLRRSCATIPAWSSA